MKKYLFILTISLSIISARASAQFKIGVEAGAAFNILKGSCGLTDTKHGARVGITGNYTLKNKFQFETGVAYAFRGAKFTGLVSDPWFREFDSNAQYLQIPITAGYVTHLTNNIFLIPKAGFFLDIGLPNSTAHGVTINGDTYSVPLYGSRKIVTRNHYFNKVDCGMAFGFDILYKYLAFKFSYNMGIGGYYGMYTRYNNSQSINISLSYYFWKNKKRK